MSFRRFDATHTLVTYLLKPIEQGLDVKITGGVHRGCLRIQAGIKTDIRTVEDLRGKRIAVSTMGGPPMIFASRVLSEHGIDVRKEITWVVYPADSTQLALDRGRVDAVANSEPIGSLLLDQKCVRTIVDQMVDAPYKDEFCCAVVVNGPLARQDPATAAKLTRAILRGAKWVGVNPRAAAEIEVRRRYVSKASVDLNAAVLTKLAYEPAIETCRTGIDAQAVQMKSSGVLNESTDPHALARRTWMTLDGVTDDYVRTGRRRPRRRRRPGADVQRRPGHAGRPQPVVLQQVLRRGMTDSEPARSTGGRLPRVRRRSGQLHSPAESTDVYDV